MAELSGNTRVFGILADPIHQVKTPQRLTDHFAALGFDGVCVPLHVGAADLAAVVAGLRGIQSLGGFIVTVPHKTAILDLVDEATPVARAIGAANVVRRLPDGRLQAHMLDGEGFVRGLREAGVSPQGKTAYLAGAGGAASAIAFALIEAGVTSLTVYNRTQSKADDLKARLLSLHPDAQVMFGTPDPGGHDLVINSTSLGMSPQDPLPLDASRLDPGQLVCEVIMQPRDTALLLAAQAKGCRIQYGAPMLACQIALMAQALGVAAGQCEVPLGVNKP